MMASSSHLCFLRTTSSCNRDWIRAQSALPASPWRRDSLTISGPCRQQRRSVLIHAQQQPQPSPDTTSTSGNKDEDKEELAAKLAAAEAEAEALRKELAARRAEKDVDLSKLKPATPEKRIDGIGYRETLFSGKEAKQPNSWGLLEAELFLSKGAPTEGAGLGGPVVDDGSNEIVKRRLIIGLGVSAATLGLAFFKLPQGLIKPSKPLFFYLVAIIRLREQLNLIEVSSSDANSVRKQLQQALNSDSISKDTFLSAASLLEGDDADKAASLTYNIFDYLNQADYNKYFEALGTPSASQQLEFYKFSLRAVQTARENIDLFLSLMPKEALDAANSNLNISL